jgi:hypothetical protein
MSMSSSDEVDARRTAEKVLHRDRRRIRQWAVLAVGLWMLAALLIPSVYLPVGAKLKQFAIQMQASAPPGFNINQVPRDSDVFPVPTAQEMPQMVADLRHQQWIVSQIILRSWIVGAIILAFALAAGILASISTVALALTIRRVTLRQVSEQLAEISRQLDELRRR